MDNIGVEHLFFAYEKEIVIQDATFFLQKGELTAFFGPNGGGKSTLLHLLMGLYTPLKGKISIFGQNVIQASEQIGYVPQHFVFDKEFPISVLEVVLGGLTLPWYGKRSHQDKEKAFAILEKVHLEKVAHRPFAALSGGQQQRVLIARALVSDPTILFLDEPTSSIDSDAKRMIYELLSSLKGSLTIILVSHDLQNVLQLADRFFCVQTTVTPLKKEEICTHMPLGLYHENKRNS